MKKSSETTPTPASLESIRGFLLDMDGTIYLGDKIFPWSLHFIETLQRFNLKFLFLTNNSSKNRWGYEMKLNHMGIPVSERQILTSGEATVSYLNQKAGLKKIFVLGTNALETEFRQSGYELDDLDPQMVILGFDTGLNYSKLTKICDLVRRGLPYIATHPDMNCPAENGFIPDIGATIAFIEASTHRRPDEIIGKPGLIMTQAAADKLNLNIEDLAIVGDRLYTDIAMSACSAITSILVLSGETRPEDVPASPFQPDYIFSHTGELADRLEALYQNTDTGLTA